MAVPQHEENFDLVEHLRKARAQRAYEKFLTLKGKVHITLDIDEARGRKDRAMSETRTTEVPPAAPEDEENLVEHLKKVRAQRAYEKLLALKGKIHLNIDIDELRGRNRR